MILKSICFHIGNVMIYLNYLKLTGLRKSLLFCALFSVGWSVTPTIKTIPHSFQCLLQKLISSAKPIYAVLHGYDVEGLAQSEDRLLSLIGEIRRRFSSI